MIYYLNLTVLIKPLKLYFTMYLQIYCVKSTQLSQQLCLFFRFLSKLDEVPNIYYNLCLILNFNLFILIIY